MAHKLQGRISGPEFVWIHQSPGDEQRVVLTRLPHVQGDVDAKAVALFGMIHAPNLTGVGRYNESVGTLRLKRFFGSGHLDLLKAIGDQNGDSFSCKFTGHGISGLKLQRG